MFDLSIVRSPGYLSEVVQRNGTGSYFGLYTLVSLEYVATC